MNVYKLAVSILLALGILTGFCASLRAEEKKSGPVLFPIFSYAPETRAALGVFGMLVGREPGDSPEARPSSLKFMVIQTQNSQTILQLSPELVTKDKKYIFGGALGYVNYPSKFFGIGNDTPKDSEEDYTMKAGSLQLSAQRQVSAVSRVGARCDYWDLKLDDIDPAGMLAVKTVTGSGGCKITGAGLTYEYDTRDNIFSAARGAYHNLYAGVSDRSLGSDFGYVKYEANLRRYLSVASGSVLAFHAKLDINNGDTPFQLMPFAGGPYLLRGYYEDRYKDRNFAGFQAEYRMPLTQKVGVCVFGAAGEVAPRIEDFSAAGIKPSAGAGWRFLVNKEEKISIRVDYGIGVDSSGFYVNIAEAF